MQKSSTRPLDENDTSQLADAAIVEFPFAEVIARLDGTERPQDDAPQAADVLRRFFLDVTAIDLNRPNASGRIGRRFFAAIKKIQPELLKELPNVIR